MARLLRFMDWPSEVEHHVIERVHDDVVSWVMEWGTGGTAYRKSEYAEAPRVGDTLSFWWHGIGTPIFRMAVGERVIRDFPEDWLGFDD